MIDRNKLVLDNLGLIGQVVRNYWRVKLIRAAFGEEADMFQIGVLGLMRAAEHFDASRGCKFSTLAVWCIRHEILSARQNSLIRIPKVTLYAAGCIAQGKPVTPRMRGLAMAAARVQYVGQLIERGDNTQGYRYPSEHSSEHCLECRAASPDETAELRDEVEHLGRLLQRLPDLDHSIIAAHYGLDGRKPRTMRDISAELGLTRQRVYQIEAKAIRKLRTLTT